MKKRIFTFVLALTLIFSISAAAATRYNNLFSHMETVSASHSGIKCTVDITPNSGVKLTASGTVTLYLDGKYVTSWSVDSLYFSKTYTRVSRGTYRMDYDITIKGPAGTDHLTGSKSDTY